MNRKSETKRAHILETGSPVMHRLGYNGAGVNDIVKAAGIPKGSFYNYFESKEDFAIQAMRYHGQLIRKQFMVYFEDQNQSPVQQIFKCFEEFILHFENNCLDGCFIANVAQEMADVNQKISDIANSELHLTEQLFSKVIQRSILLNEISKTHDPMDLAEFILNAWEGSLIRMKSKNSTDPLHNFLKNLKKLI